MKSPLLIAGGLEYALNEAPRVDLDARTHGGSDHTGFDILALCRSGFRLDDRAEQGVEVLLELLRAERDLTDRAVDDVGFVETVLDLTGFRLLDRLGDIRRSEERRVGKECRL